MKSIVSYFGLATCLFYGFSAHAGDEYLRQLKIPDEITAYSKAYEKAQKTDKPQSIENIFKLGEQAKEAFFAANDSELISNIVWSEEGQKVNDQREQFEKKMAVLVPGYQIRQGAELFYYDIDSEEFMELANKHGTEIDKHFFNLYRKSFPNSETWPVYVEQQSDITSCTKYGSPEYLGFYTDWQSFIEHSPKSYYAEIAQKYLNDFNIDAACSCDSKKSSIKGLENLLAIVDNNDTKKMISSAIEKRKAPPSSSDEVSYAYNRECPI